jgi:predicted RNA binding protein YcfA (HicA-like mRNA interferase family)
MPRKLRQLRADLKAAGAYIATKTPGSHEKWKHPDVADMVELAGNDGKDAHHYQERQVKRFIEKIRRSCND